METYEIMYWSAYDGCRHAEAVEGWDEDDAVSAFYGQHRGQMVDVLGVEYVGESELVFA